MQQPTRSLVLVPSLRKVRIKECAAGRSGDEDHARPSPEGPHQRSSVMQAREIGPYVAGVVRRQLHGLSHPAGRDARELIRERFVRLSISRGCVLHQSGACTSCRRMTRVNVRTPPTTAGRIHGPGIHPVKMAGSNSSSELRGEDLGAADAEMVNGRSLHWYAPNRRKSKRQSWWRIRSQHYRQQDLPEGSSIVELEETSTFATTSEPGTSLQNCDRCTSQVFAIGIKGTCGTSDHIHR